MTALLAACDGPSWTDVAMVAGVVWSLAAVLAFGLWAASR